MSVSDLFTALAKVPPETYADLARTVTHVATAPNPADAARRVAEETARIVAFDQAMARAKP